MINSSAFAECSNLENVVLSNQSGLELIGPAAFKNDRKLDTSFAANVDRIVENAFAGIAQEETTEEEQTGEEEQTNTEEQNNTEEETRTEEPAKEAKEEPAEKPENGTGKEPAAEETEEEPVKPAEETEDETAEEADAKQTEEEPEETEAPATQTDLEAKVPTVVRIYTAYADIHAYISFMTDAGIPEDAKLQIRELKPAEQEAYQALTAQALNAENESYLRYTRYIELSLIHEGEAIPLTAPVEVYIVLSDVNEGMNALQVVRFDNMEPVLMKSELTDDLAIILETDTFGIFGIGNALVPVSNHETELAKVEVLSFSEDTPVTLAEAEAPEVEEGLEVLGTFTIEGSTAADAEGENQDGLFIKAELKEDAELNPMEGVALYSVDENGQTDILMEELTEDAKITELEATQVAVVKDTGYRHLTLTVNPDESTDDQIVTLDGMMPKGAEAAIEDITAMHAAENDMELSEENFAAETTDSDAGTEADGDRTAAAVENTDEDAADETPADATGEEAEAAETGEEPEEAREKLIAAYNISILNGTEEYQPDEEKPITVEILDSRITAGKNIQLWHIKDDGTREQVTEFTVEEGRITFEATGFSVYTIVDAPEPFVSAPTKVQDLAELAGNYLDPDTGLPVPFFLSYANTYATNVLNAKGAFVETNNTNSASKWYFEPAGSDNKYRVYTKIDGATLYMQNTKSNEMGLTDNVDKAVVFDLSEADTEKFYFKANGANKWFQHSNGGSGMRFWTDNDDPTNPRISITYANSVSIPDDYYQLSGKTYSIAYHEESVRAAGMLKQTKTFNSNPALEAAELIARPDLLSSSGDLLIYQDSELTDWTFECVEADKYYITTLIGGVKKYLTLNGKSLTLEDDPTEKSKIQVILGTGENEGKFQFKVGNYALCLSAGKVENGFVSSSDGLQYSWMRLATKSTTLEESDFVVYSAEKVDLSDPEQVPNGAQVIVYTRLWNETTKKYEYYTLNHDGSLIRCYESGNLVQWVGSQVNTALWDFTEYYYEDNVTPNYYYELQNTYGHKYIAPQASSEQILSNDPIGINLNGRRYGYYYTSILAWDNNSYAYSGLKAKDDRSGVETCPMGEADSFYFAILKPVDNTEKTTVETVDNRAHGITMKMIDFDARSVPSGFLGNNDGGLGTTLHQGMLSTDLASDGYPKNKDGVSMSTLYSGATTVNHLFLSSTYYSGGYYEYNSTQNFASFYNEEKGEWDYGNFTVYQQLGSLCEGTTGPTRQHGQFLPYNRLTDTASPINPYNLYDAEGHELPDSNPRKGEILYGLEGETDYYFGMELSASFTQTVSGKDAWGHDIIYEFTGDDDFWLYVDGELLIDLGGIHSAVAGSVNYRTGDVYVNGVHKTLRQIFTENFTKRYKEAHNGADPSADEVAAFLAQYFDGDETVFSDYSDHTMRIFYMERGAGASNLHMRFNLAAVKPGTVLLSKEIVGVEDTSSYMAEYPFQIFYKNSDDPEAEEHMLVPSDNIPIVYKDTNRAVTFYADGQNGSTQYKDPDGRPYDNVFVLKPGEMAEIKFPDDAMVYRIQECSVDVTRTETVGGQETVTYQGVYTKVTVNDTELTGTDIEDSQRRDYSLPNEQVLKRTRVNFQNHVDERAKGTMTFVKHLYAEDGETRILHDDSDGVTFTFRLYLGTENEEYKNLPLANMYKYHVKDKNGNYCKWTVRAGFESLGKNDFSLLTAAEKAAATFTTSMNGTIDKIPVDYTVEVRDIPQGNKYIIEERPYELPDGYTLQWYLEEAGNETNKTKIPARGVINVATGNNVEIRNLKGWGLRVYKNWSDAEVIEERDPIYFAVYKNDGGQFTLVDGTVKRMNYGDESIYWFFQTIEGGATGFGKYEAHEVVLAPGTYTVDEDTNIVTVAEGNITRLDVRGDNAGNSGHDNYTISGKQAGEENTEQFTYAVVKYEKGELPDGANVRKDYITNKRQGIDLYKYEWDGTTELAGATFELKDQDGHVLGTYTSDATGYIGTIYIREDEDYTLTEISAPAGYRGMQGSLTIRRSGTDVTVKGGESKYWKDDDEDITSGEDIRISRINIKNKQYTLSFKKTALTEDGPGLDEVVFDLYNQVEDIHGGKRRDYTPIAGFSGMETGTDGIVPLITAAFADGTLPAGTYYLHETAPLLNYRPLSSDVLFTVSETGVVSLDDSSPSNVVLRETTNGDTIEDLVIVPNLQAETVQYLYVNKVVLNPTTADLNGNNEFTFTAKLYQPDGLTPWDHTTATDSIATARFVNGVASFTMHDYNPDGATLAEKNVALLEVPVGAVVTVAEDIINGYTTTAELNDFVEGRHSQSTLDEYNETFRTSTVTINDGVAVLLTYTNTRQTVNAKITKTIAGKAGDTFTFTVQLKDNDQAVEGYTIFTDPNNSSNNITTDESGEATFTLKPTKDKGSASKIFTIPYGSELTVTEEEHEHPYITKVKVLNGANVTGRTGTLTPTQTGTTDERTIVFTNTPDTKLTITKTVAGGTATGQEFTFTLKSVAGAAADATYDWTKTAADSSVTTGTTAVNGTFTLADGDSLVLTVPYNKDVVIEETEASGFTTSWKLGEDGESTEGRSATVNITENKTLAFTNAIDNTAVQAPTGLSTRHTPFLLLLAFGAIFLTLGGIGIVRSRKRTTETEPAENRVQSRTERVEYNMPQGRGAPPSAPPCPRADFWAQSQGSTGKRGGAG